MDAKGGKQVGNPPKGSWELRGGWHLDLTRRHPVLQVVEQGFGAGGGVGDSGDFGDAWVGAGCGGVGEGEAARDPVPSMGI